MFLKDPEFYLFIIKLSLVFFVSGLVIGGIIQKLFNKTESISKALILTLGIGFAPFWIATMLYYLFLLVPGNADIIYLILVYGSLIGMAIYAKSGIADLLFYIKFKLKFWFKTYLWLTLASIVMLMMFCVGWSYYITSKLLTEHDALEYAVQGKVFYSTKLIAYSAHRVDALSGFYYVGLHGFSFPLQATNERLLNGLLNANNDFLFRSFNSIYGILILVGMAIFGFKRNGLWFSLLFVFGLLISYGFFETIMKYHIDNFRIFFFLASIFLALNYLKKGEFHLLILATIFIAAQANAHSLGCLLAIVFLGILFIFAKTPLLLRIKQFGIVAGVFLVFGGLHYLLDVMIGTGWIFQEVKFY